MAEPRLGISGLLARSFQANPLTPVLALAGLLLGLAAVLVTPREEEPQIDVTMANVMVPFAGAGAEDVENLVAYPLEQVLAEIEGVEHVYSTSRPGAAVLTVQFEVGVPRQEAIVRLYNQVYSNGDWVPPGLGVGQPLVRPMGIDDVPVMALTLWTDDPARSAVDLAEVAHTLETELKRVPGTRDVYTLGAPDRAVTVELDATRLAAYGMALEDLATSLAAANLVRQAGERVGPDGNVPVTAGSFLADQTQVADLVVGRSAGGPVLLSDVATITRGASQPVRLAWHGAPAGSEQRPQAGVAPAVTLAIAKQPGRNAADITSAIAERVAALQGRMIPEGVRITLTRDYGATATDKAMTLITKLVFATGSVVLLVLFALGWREAIVIGSAVILTLALTLFASWAMGFTLNRVSLFALIFSIGILVDDAIVIVENIHRHMQRDGRSLLEAIPPAVEEVGGPTILATFTVIAALLPMAFVSGLMGPYMRPIPINASVGMLISLLIALTVTPWLSLKLLRRHHEKAPPKHPSPSGRGTGENPSPPGRGAGVRVRDDDQGAVGEDLAKREASAGGGRSARYEARVPRRSASGERTLTPTPLPEGEGPSGPEGKGLPEENAAGLAGRLHRLFSRLLRPFLDPRRGTRNRRLLYGSMALGVALAAGLAVVQLVVLKMLPFDNKSELQVVVDLPEGRALEDTSALLLELGQAVNEVPEVQHWQAYAGTSAPVNFNGLVRQYYLREGANVGDLQVGLVDKGERTRKSHDIARALRPQLAAIGERHGASVKVVEVPPGPPVLSPLVAEVYGPDYATQRRIGRELADRFRATDGIVDVDTSVEAAAQREVVVVDRDRAARYGISQAQVAEALAIGVSGVDATYLHDGASKYAVPIRIRLPAGDRASMEQLLALRVRAADGRLVPLSEITRVERLAWEGAIHHKDLLPVVYVTGDEAGDADSPLYGMFDLVGQLNESEVAGFRLGQHFLSQPRDVGRFAVKWDGEWQITYETFRDMGAAYAVGLVLIYLLVVAQFRSYLVPLIIMAPIPLTVIGVMPGHALLGAQFTATSMIGMIALAGIIVRNSILLVDFIDQARAEGRPLADAVVEACAVRAQPIALTALAAMIGALFILDDPIFNGLAISLLSGVLVSTVLTLVVIPLLYYGWLSRPGARKEATA